MISKYDKKIPVHMYSQSASSLWFISNWIPSHAALYKLLGPKVRDNLGYRFMSHVPSIYSVELCDSQS